MESYWRSAPTAEDFEQLVDPDAKAPCESASNFDPITIVIERCFYCIFCRWGGVNIGCRSIGSKLQIVLSFKLVDVGSGGVKIRRRNTAWPRRVRRDTRSTTGCEQARRLDPAMFKKSNGLERGLASGRPDPELSNTQVAYRR
jgi:hypothetical protein